MIKLSIARWSWPDLWRALQRTDPAPAPDPALAPLGRLLESADRLGIEVLDLRGTPRDVHYDTKVWGWFRDGDPKLNIPSRGRARGTLPWKQRTAVMLHRTGVRMTARRFLGCPCHAAVASDGTIVLCHPPDAYVWAAHAANRFAVSVEVSSADGLITVRQGVAARLLVGYVVQDLWLHDAPGPVMMAHRMSHRSRPHDPGAHIWRHVAVPVMQDLTLKLGPVVGSGRPLPVGEDW